MTCDVSGSLWVGTEDGLARWNGKGFEVFRRPDRDVSNLVLRVWSGPTPDTLWVSFADGDLTVFREGPFEPLADAALWERGHVKGLTRTGRGTVVGSVFGRVLSVAKRAG